MGKLKSVNDVVKLALEMARKKMEERREYIPNRERTPLKSVGEVFKMARKIAESKIHIPSKLNNNKNE